MASTQITAADARRTATLLRRLGCAEPDLADLDGLIVKMDSASFNVGMEVTLGGQPGVVTGANGDGTFTVVCHPGDPDLRFVDVPAAEIVI